MVDQVYLSVPSIAEKLDVDTEQVLSWIHSGQLKAANVAKNPNGKRPRWRVAEGDLGRFVLSRMNSASQPSPRTPTRQLRQPKQIV